MTDPNAPITPQVLFEHVANLRAEVAALRTVAENLALQTSAARVEGETFRAHALAFKDAARDLANELLVLSRWREAIEQRIGDLEGSNGAHP